MRWREHKVPPAGAGIGAFMSHDEGDEDRYQRRRDERKDAEDKTRREGESRRRWNRIHQLDRKIRDGYRDIEYEKLEAEVDRLYTQMSEGKAEALAEISQHTWAREKWYDTLKEIRLTLPDAEAKLDALLSAVRDHNESLILPLLSYLGLSVSESQAAENQRKLQTKRDIESIETTLRLLRSKCGRYHAALR